MIIIYESFSKKNCKAFIAICDRTPAKIKSSQRRDPERDIQVPNLGFDPFLNFVHIAQKDNILKRPSRKWNRCKHKASAGISYIYSSVIHAVYSSSIPSTSSHLSRLSLDNTSAILQLATKLDIKILQHICAFQYERKIK